jgi:ABC-type transport system substrate-binding protein
MAYQEQHSLKRWGIFAIVAIVLSTLLWLGLSLTHHHNIFTDASLQADTTMSVGLRTSPDSLDIRSTEGTPVEQALLTNVYETLVTRDTKNELHPGLAKSWDISKDALTYTFTLRSGVRFSNGHVLDATDAVWSLQHILSEKYLGSEELGDLQSVANPDSSSLVITLKSPNPRLLRVLSTRVGIVYDSQAKVNYEKTAVGSGPFVVSDYVQGQSITLKRNTDYWGTQARTSQITLRYFSDDASMVEAMRQGDISMAIPAGTDIEKQVDNDPTLHISDGLSTDKTLIAFNSSADSIFSDQHVRQATRFAIDAAALASSQPNAAQSLGGPISQLEPGYEDLTGLFPYDPSQAQSLLSYFSASYLGTITFLVPQEYQDLGTAITQQLTTNTPFTVDMQVLDDESLQTQLHDGKYSIALITMGGVDDLNDFANANSIFHYENGNVQQQYAALNTTTTQENYEKGLREVARTISEDAPAQWLYTQKSRVLVRAKTSGYPINMVDQILPLSQLAVH